MNLTVNGESRTFEQPFSVHQLLTELSLNEKRVVIELNEAIVDKDSYIDTSLSDGDCLEIIQFVPGG
ncbi:MAG: sulfur carrier protein ThiS [Lentisphaeria bacterium]|nr:sulfur carrier protein ThiS [Lentisphaeria bacterium]